MVLFHGNLHTVFFVILPTNQQMDTDDNITSLIEVMTKQKQQIVKRN